MHLLCQTTHFAKALISGWFPSAIGKPHPRLHKLQFQDETECVSLLGANAWQIRLWVISDYGKRKAAEF